MKRWLNIVTQSLALVGHSVLPGLPLDPATKALVHTILAGVQGIVGIIAHNFNPDGTTVKVAYYPKKKGGGRVGGILG